ncbi:24990_t:CDS:2 [Cetraspora pellucida]|uniref:24990_t:CDS:1 n=1 Tax=Cetraspora pellucida TaxID=1433469 RepID=A0A9N9HKS7_9GLOM|nr:24990_t:CDS:2 [Cetraspora pellucida]
MLYFSFYVISFFLNIIFTYAFIPNGRLVHSSVLLDRKIYFSGGSIIGANASSSSTSNEFFYLNVSKPFTTTDDALMPWNDLTNTNGPLKASATACVGGKNNDMIFIFGGFPYGQSFVNQFDQSKQQWTNVTTTGSAPSDRDSISCAKFNNGSIAIFSGWNVQNDLWIFNTLTLTWSLGNATNTPPARYGYRAITLPDDNILYIGGRSPADSSFFPMNNFPLLNTKSNTWTNVSASGPTPPVRYYFSAVLTPDGRIIIFGGFNATVSFGDLWVLDITTYQWSAGNILNSIADLALRGYSATLVDNNYMFISFGKFTNESYSSKIFMLDISQKDSYKWVTEFIVTPSTTISSNTIPSNTILTTPTPNTTTQSSTSSSEFGSSKSTSFIIVAIIGGTISLVIITIAIILTLKHIDKYK